MKVALLLILIFSAGFGFCQKTPTDEQVIEFIKQTYRPSDNFNPIISQPLNAEYLHFNPKKNGIISTICIVLTQVKLYGSSNTVFCRFVLNEDKFVPTTIFGVEKYSFKDLNNDSIPEVIALGDILSTPKEKQLSFFIFSLSDLLPLNTGTTSLIFSETEFEDETMDTTRYFFRDNQPYPIREPSNVYVKVLKRKFVDVDKDGVCEMIVQYKYGYFLGFDSRNKPVYKYSTTKKKYRMINGMYKFVVD